VKNEGSIATMNYIQMPSSEMVSKMVERREREFAEFLNPDYKWLISSMTRTDDETITLVLNDTSVAIIKRSTDVFEPPKIYHNGVHLLIPASAYNPAYTSIHYLVSLLFDQPECSYSDN
jgi:hypothetical protein